MFAARWLRTPEARDAGRLAVSCLLTAALSSATGQGPPASEETRTAAASSVSLPAGVSSELRTALQAGNDDRLEPLLLEEIERRPDSPELLSALGGVFFRKGKHLNAAIAFKKSDALAPLDDSSRFTLAMAYVVLGRRDWARPEIEKLTGANPDEALYVYWLGRLDYDDQRFAEAIVKFKGAVRLDPGFARAYDRVGLCYEALGRLEEGVVAYRKAVQLNRNEAQPSAWPPVNLGTLLYRLDRLEEAGTYLREAVGYDPRFARARYQMGMLLDRQGKREEAIEHLEQAARLDPDDPKPYYAMGRVYRALGEKEQARVALEKFKELEKQETQEKTNE